MLQMTITITNICTVPEKFITVKRIILMIEWYKTMRYGTHRWVPYRNHRWFVPIVSWKYLHLYLKSIIDWFFVNCPILPLDLVITYLSCFTMRFIFIWFILYKLQHDILSWWFDCKSNYDQIKKHQVFRNYNWITASICIRL